MAASFGNSSALGLALALSFLALGCGSKESVSLGAHVGNVALTVTEQTLGTQLTGSFDLFLEVGPEADGAATVTLESFALVRASDQSSVVPVLDAVPQGVVFPVQVGKGQSRTIGFVLDDTELLATSDKANICAGAVQVVGAVKHNLNGGETKPLRSTAFNVSGCQ